MNEPSPRTGDPVRQVLADRGCPDDVVQDGIAGLLRRWEAIVASVETGYPLGLDDYLNDMDLRDALGAALAVSPPGNATEAMAHLTPLDDRLRDVSVATECLWGSDIEDDDGLDAQREWWYYRRPVQLNEDFAAELQAWGLLHDPEEST